VRRKETQQKLLPVKGHLQLPQKPAGDRRECLVPVPCEIQSGFQFRGQRAEDKPTVLGCVDQMIERKKISETFSSEN
jgi:hypothetical protein